MEETAWSVLKRNGAPPGRDLKGRTPPRPPMARMEKQDNYDASGLKVIPLTHIAHALFLVGTLEEIRKAEDIIYQVESTVGEAKEKVIFWYTTKHADPDELGALLDRIYRLMVATGAGLEKKGRPPQEPQGPPPLPPKPPEVALNQLQMGYLSNVTERVG